MQGFFRRLVKIGRRYSFLDILTLFFAVLHLFCYLGARLLFLWLFSCIIFLVDLHGILSRPLLRAHILLRQLWLILQPSQIQLLLLLLIHILRPLTSFLLDFLWIHSNISVTALITGALSVTSLLAATIINRSTILALHLRSSLTLALERPLDPWALLPTVALFLLHNLCLAVFLIVFGHFFLVVVVGSGFYWGGFGLRIVELSIFSCIGTRGLVVGTRSRWCLGCFGCLLWTYCACSLLSGGLDLTHCFLVGRPIWTIFWFLKIARGWPSLLVLLWILLLRIRSTFISSILILSRFTSCNTIFIIRFSICSFPWIFLTRALFLVLSSRFNCGFRLLFLSLILGNCGLWIGSLRHFGALLRIFYVFGGATLR